MEEVVIATLLTTRQFIRREPGLTSGAPVVVATSAEMASATSGGKGAVVTVSP